MTNIIKVFFLFRIWSLLTGESFPLMSIPERLGTFVLQNSMQLSGLFTKKNIFICQVSKKEINFDLWWKNNSWHVAKTFVVFSKLIILATSTFQPCHQGLEYCCIPTIMIIIMRSIQRYKHIYKCKTQADSIVLVQMHLLTSDFSSLTRGERHNS